MLVIDIEATGLKPWYDDIVIITVLDTDDRKIKIYKSVSDELASKLKDYTILKVFHNSAYDVGMLEWNGYKVNNVQCTWVMATVLNERQTKLKDLAKKYCGIDMDKTLQQGDNWNGKLTKEHLEYAKMDVIATYELYKKLKDSLEQKNLWSVFERENKANRIIHRLNGDGVRFDYNGWKKILDAEKKDIEKLKAKIIKELNLNDLNLNSPIQLRKALKQNGIDIEGTSDAVLAMYEEEHHVIKLIRRYKKLIKQQNAYGEKLKDSICEDGRIRGNWKIIGAETGRMSCTKPPLQGMPKASREFFKAEQGNKLVIADYSQAELRVLAELSKDEKMIRYFKEGIDLHTGTASLVFKVSVEKVSKEQRQIAKALNFGMSYGITEYGIQKRIVNSGVKISLEEARDLRVRFLEEYEGIQKMQDALLGSLSVMSCGGRRWKSKNLKKNKRLNYPIQSTAAEGFKEALIRLYDEMKPNWLICAAVHDEIVLEVPEEDAEGARLILVKCMKEGMEVFIKGVPIEVDAKIGDYWIK